MSKNISKQNQMNLWGKQQSSGSTSLEVQRNDLFMVDLWSAAKQIKNVARMTVPTPLPQFVRSISFPEVTVKPEAFRRNSIAYNMPSWDDPVGPVKIVFLVDTWETDADRSDVVELLDIWIGLVRAGRGSRNNGYKPYVGHFTLDANYGVTCQFDINVSLLRGTVPQMSDAQLLKRNNEINTVAYEQSMVDYQQQVQAIGEEPGLINPPSFTGGGNIFSTTDLLEHTKWVLRRAWCGGYKLSDLNYQETQVTTVEATFYPETIERNTATYIYGAASAISNQP